MKIKHPSLPNVRDVSDAGPWIDQGWVPVDGPAPEPDPEPEAPEADDEEPAEAPAKRRKR